ncbi:MAG: bifunctional phosphopantothenoylcysteine decarboxylase/phosphopantothenate--cysteine ligase CoaBC [Deinococcus sp.]|nr:bifunctional phosphopantothenoylcysteine decarboxylase/phosphopantothenate--cysteine ligase CoaBC [Deinococcus sp.]
MATIVLGVTGSIAAYKAPNLIRRLRERGHRLRVVATQHALEFITPLSLSITSGEPIFTNLWAEASGQESHIVLAQTADLILVAPATANALAKAALGLADDLLSTLLLATTAPVLWAPAMNTVMWDHPATQHHVATLLSRGHHLVGPVEGSLADMSKGMGRLADEEQILAAVEQVLSATHDLAGHHLLATAGPTHEFWDPVRFVSNPSSGRMGLAVAEEALARGAQVTLVCGPIALAPPTAAKVVQVTSALEMQQAVETAFDSCDAVVMAAAVSDYRFAQTETHKHKKTGESETVTLLPNPDILASLGKRKGQKVLVGFAMETGNGLAAAQEKLRRKHLDLIVLNDLRTPGAGFGVETNVVTLIRPEGQPEQLSLMSKRQVARHILDEVAKLLKSRRPTDAAAPRSGIR